ncbi:MAG: methyl-accepting chemotaxis protein [Pontibacterium sp.]
MGFIDRLGFKHKLALPAVVLGIAILLLGVLAYHSIKHLEKDINLVVNTEFPAIVDTLSAERELYAARLAQENYINFKAHQWDTTGLKETFEANAKKSYAHVEEYHQLMAGSAAEQILRDFDSAYSTWYNLGKKAFQLADAGQIEQAMTLSHEELLHAFEKLNYIYHAAAEHATSSSVEHVEKTQSFAHERVLLVACAAIAGLVLGIFALSLSYSSSVKSLNQLSKRAKQVADGDLTSRIQVSANDELGAMAKSFNQVIEHFQTVISGLKHGADRITQACEVLGEKAVENEGSVARQSVTLEQLAVAINQIKGELENTSRNTAHSAVTVTDASGISIKSFEANKVANEKVRDLSAHMDRSIKQIEEVSNVSSGIGQMIEDISDIADQTNLLALNAAIEAARAGDQGRGFAVVADEVRNLATRTQNATTEIHSLIDRLNAGVSHSVASINTSTELAQHTTERLTDSETANQNIHQNLETLSNLSSTIACAAEEQANVISEVQQSASDLSQRLIASKTRSQVINTVSNKLVEQASAFRHEFDRFCV